MAEPTNTPMPPGTPVPASTPRPSSPALPAPSRPIVLHIGDPIKYNPTTYAEFSSAFEVIRPSAAERERDEFIRALKERRWGDFSAIFRPFWGTGGEMGRWDAELIDLLPDSMRVFASAGAGFDWADTKLLGAKGIIYCNSGLAAAEAVADFAVAMIISTFRHLPWCMTAAIFPFPSPQFTDPSYTTNTRAREAAFQTCHARATAVSHNPRGHVLGLIGFGNIGQQIAAKLGNPAFGMRIAYYDVVRKPPALEASLNATFHPTLESLLQSSDCIVLGTPAFPDGKPLVTASTLAAFRPGARFVNVARGSLVDEDALADALESGVVSAAALDVHADEPRPNPRLVRMATQLAGVPGGDDDNADGGGARLPGPGPGRVMLTCHNAGGTVETHVGFEELSMRNILAVLRGGEAMTAVNLEFLEERG
ncbi:D-isomer specific 2-hydroxyacid dehydrogenase [Chaetomidium leptoderma]|uniref:D-isomer specific 2-hydroxyacid dehydrogenase n=1 Tax=Chaetomidium leptoderma TaxID=669021 RepID=A0AAN6VHV5_9PEZI|nr:D-isomer specific 2-hydroxyacid dehydrogenase [Chaetomidium leptoderma]